MKQNKALWISLAGLVGGGICLLVCVVLIFIGAAMYGLMPLGDPLAVGSVAPTPLRLLEVEAILEGASLSQELLSEAQQLASRCVSPISDVRSSAEYRYHLVGVMVKRALETLLGKDFRDKR